MALSRISGTTGIVDGSITSAKLADFSAAVDLNGVELILDADADTSISADTDDQIDIKIANADHLKILSSSGDTVLKPMVDAKDIIFQQFDGNKVFEINDGNFVSVGGNATAAGQIRIYEDTDNGSHYSGFTVGNLTASVAYQLPNADGSSGQQLTTDGSGVLSWAVAGTNPPSADGDSLGTASLEWSDLFLADGGTIQFGNDQDVTLTHVADTGLLLSATDQLQFGDSGTYIHQSANGVLDLVSDTEIELNATTIDINGNVEISGTTAQTGVLTANAGVVIDNITIDGTEIDLSSGDLTIDVAGDIVLDADGGDVFVKDAGTTFGSLTNTSGNLIIKSGTTTAATFSGANVTFAGTIGSGAITSTGIVTGTAFTAGSAVLAEAELELLDGLTAGTAIASKVVTTDANIDTTGQRNLTISGELDAATLDISGDADIDGTTNLDVVDIDGALTQDGGAVFNEASADVDFRIESNGSTHALFVDGGNNRIGIGTDTPDFSLHMRSMGSPSNDTVLCLEGGATDANCRLTFQNSGGTTEAQISYDTDDDNLQFIMAGSEIARFRNARLGIGNTNPLKALDVTGDAKVSTDLTVGDDLFMLSDAAVIHFGADSEITLTHDHNTGLILNTEGTANSLAIVSGDDDTAGGPSLNLKRDSATPADNDGLGAVIWTGRNDNSQDFQAAIIKAQASDVSDGEEDSFLYFRTMHAGSELEHMAFLTTETVFNDPSNDIDFRVESNGDANCFVVDAGGDRVDIRTGGANLGGVFNVLGGTVLQTDDNSNTLELISTDNDTAEGPILAFNRSVSDVAAGDLIGTIKFLGEDDAGNAALYHEIQASIEDGSNGGEDGRLTIYQSIAGATKNVLDLKSGEIVFNQDAANLDFRVEADDLTYAIYLNAGRNELVIGSNTDYSARFAVDETRTDHRVANFEGNSSSYAETAVNFAVPKNATDFNFFKCEARGFANKLTVRGDGNVTNTNNSYGAISDERLKTNIVDANSQWNDIKALKIRNFKVKTDPNQDVNIGVISQELETANMNGLVTETEADEYQIAAIDDTSILKEGDNVKEVKYSVLYMKAIKALQEAMTKIETLESKVQALEDA